jgi:endo-1,4-beta-xylanase
MPGLVRSGRAQTSVKNGRPITGTGSLKASAEAFASIDGATALGLQVFITELDGNDDAVATTNMTERNKIVANAYGSYLTAALERPEVRAVLTWGVSDKNSWLNNGTKFRKQHPERLQRPLPFDPDYLPAPAFFAMRTSFEKTMNR